MFRGPDADEGVVGNANVVGGIAGVLALVVVSDLGGADAADGRIQARSGPTPRSR